MTHRICTCSNHVEHIEHVEHLFSSKCFALDGCVAQGEENSIIYFCCQQIFHKKCIETSLQVERRKNICPLCGDDLFNILDLELVKRLREIFNEATRDQSNNYVLKNVFSDQKLNGFDRRVLSEVERSFRSIGPVQDGYNSPNITPCSGRSSSSNLSQGSDDVFNEK